MSSAFKNEKAMLENADVAWKKGAIDQALEIYTELSQNAKFKVTKEKAMKRKAFALWEAGKKEEALKEFEKHFTTPQQLENFKKIAGSNQAFEIVLQEAFEQHFIELKEALLKKPATAQN